MNPIIALRPPAVSARLSTPLTVTAVFKSVRLPQAAANAAFSTSGVARQGQTQRAGTKSSNTVFASVRDLDQFHTYQLLSSSSRRPLLTLWTTSYCPTCRVVAPLMQNLVESGVGEEEGGVGFCTVEYDAPDVMSAGLGMTYMIHSIPTLLGFDAQEAQVQTKVTDGRKLADRHFLEEWIRTEARRHGGRGGGGGRGGRGGGPVASRWTSFFGGSR
ncbi:hypothetical protein QBC35DRAFT_514197 [Podospora australis]|uniref:Thioredoxin domain-containing protein n=1 Tax=Podospora australis TaxID=1536484 RepID=A0AAN6WVX3_9PEZI|nr:hypothetical protein QBC35DRAFT_514197 [Podospora australis]